MAEIQMCYTKNVLQICIIIIVHFDLLLLFCSVSAVTITATEITGFYLDFFAFAPTTTAFQASATN